MSNRVLHPFRGGLHLEAHKSATENQPALGLPTPEKLVLPLRQHIGEIATPCVRVGQRVARGDLIASSKQYVGTRLHAPATGTVSAIGEYPVIHPSGLSAPAIEISVAQDAPATVADVHRDDPRQLPLKTIVERIAAAGIVGLGGAGFPSQVKLSEGATQPVEMLIINGVECEPYISCDDCLMREHAAEIVAGAAIVARVMDAKECVFAIEAGMEHAKAALERVLTPEVELAVVPDIYPAGSEKQLITTITGREVPSGYLPIHVGVAVLNVQTVFAIYRAASAATVLTERLVTVAGNVEKPGNYRTLIGTPVGFILAHAGLTTEPAHRIISGGPMMGTKIDDLGVPVTKTVNCLLALPEPEKARAPSACIRCGDCVPVCPVGIQAQELYESCRVSDLDSAQDFHVFDCIECGCCAYVCPSSIPLVHHFRTTKSAIESLDTDRRQADRARALYESRGERLDRLSAPGLAAAVELADLTRLDEPDLGDDVAAAVARAREKRTDIGGNE